MTRYVRVGMLAGGAVMTLTGVAQADFINFDESNFVSFESPPLLSEFSVTWTYTPGSASLTLSLTNDNIGLAGGFITAIAFNVPIGFGLSLFSYSETLNGFEDAVDDLFAADGATPRPGNINHFNNVFSVDGDMFGQAGGGGFGIESGETGLFSWTVTGAGTAGLLVADFLDFNLNDGDPDIPGGEFAMALKFKELGLGGEGSEPFALIPLPAALPMGLVGLAGVAALRYRSRSARRKKPAMV